MTNDQRRTTMGEVSISRKEGIKREGQIHSTAVLKTFIREMTLLPKSLILDLGCICDTNIELFTHLGCKVFVKDLLNANAQTWTNSGGLGEIRRSFTNTLHPRCVKSSILVSQIHPKSRISDFGSSVISLMKVFRTAVE